MESTLQTPAHWRTDLSVPRSNGVVIGSWIVSALFCLQIGFTAYAQLRIPQVAEAFTHLGFPTYFRVELAWAKLLGVVLLLAPVPARLKEWTYAGFAITLGSALIAHFSAGDGPKAWGWAAGTGVLWGLSYFFWRRVQATPVLGRDMKESRERTWDQDRLAGTLAAVRHQQGRLVGRMESLGFPLQQEATLEALTEETSRVRLPISDWRDRSTAHSGSTACPRKSGASGTTTTALRDILDLVKRGVLVRNLGAGRSTSYSLADADIAERRG